MLTYSNLKDALANIKPPDLTLSNKHILRLLGAMRHPQNELNVIHITGSNGKGSTANLVQYALMGCGYRIGLFHSPGIVSVRESIQINGAWISKSDYTTYGNQVYQEARLLADLGYPHPSTFECEVAIALLYFKEQNVDVAVIEVGLGGRDDATNVFDAPMMSLITSVSLEHTDFLGNTLTDIAMHKAGIIKAGCPVIIGPLPCEAKNIIKKTAQSLASPLYEVADLLEIRLHNNQHVRITPINNASLLLPSGIYPCPLSGDHQLNNFKLAFMALSLCNVMGISLDQKGMIQGLKHLKWPCRQEWLTFQNQKILIDGAHNPESMAALVHTLKKQQQMHPHPLVLFGGLKDKDYTTMLRQLAQITQTLILVPVPNPRTASTQELEPLAQQLFKHVSVYDHYKAGLQAALKEEPTGLLVITGSLYLVMPIRQLLTTPSLCD